MLLNRGDGSFRAKLDYAAGCGGPFSVAIGDLNDDGKPDLVTAARLTVSVFLIGATAASGPSSTTQPEGATSVAIGDLNGDGRVDLATATDGIAFPCS